MVPGLPRDFPKTFPEATLNRFLKILFMLSEHFYSSETELPPNYEEKSSISILWWFRGSRWSKFISWWFRCFKSSNCYMYYKKYQLFPVGERLHITFGESRLLIMSELSSKEGGHKWCFTSLPGKEENSSNSTLLINGNRGVKKSSTQLGVSITITYASEQSS